MFTFGVRFEQTPGAPNLFGKVLFVWEGCTVLRSHDLVGQAIKSIMGHGLVWEVSKAHPAMFYPEEMLAAFPRVKVILLQREDDAWFDSYCRYYRAISWLGTRLWFLPRCRAIHRLFSRSTFAFLGEGHEHNRDNVIRARKDLYARVRALVPPEQLLEFNVQQGWAPLCRFLHKPVPEAPFPWTNKKKNAVKKAIGLALTRDLVWAGGAAAILVATVFWPPAVVLLAGEAALWALLFHLRRV